MIKTLSAYVNVDLVDYDDSMLNHVVELMKESLRELSDGSVLEDTWKVEENKRTLFKNDEGEWVPQQIEGILSEVIDMSEILEVMTVRITVNVVTIH